MNGARDTGLNPSNSPHTGTTVITPQSYLRIHGFLPYSYANGPGCRAVLWVQGCTLSCPGCFNPDSHASDGGETALLEEIFRQIVALEAKIEGITISGGEPLQQLTSTTSLLRRVRDETGLSVLLFTGYSWEEVQNIQETIPAAMDNPLGEVAARVDLFAKTSGSKRTRKAGPEILDYVDVLLAGRYRADRKVRNGLSGSSAKSSHFLTNRYCAEDLESVPPAEVILSSAGDISIAGVDPLVWKSS